MSNSSPPSQDMERMLRAFEHRLAGSVPFREDVTCLTELVAEARPVLEVVHQAYAGEAPLQGSLHEAYALFSLLCRRAATLGATPTSALALVQATEHALAAAGTSLLIAQREQLTIVAVEAYVAGRDELRDAESRMIAASSQVHIELAPRCFAVFVSGAHLPEQLETILDEHARTLFRADCRSLLLDVSRLHDPGEESARRIAGFVSTVISLGTQVFLVGADAQVQGWIERCRLPEQRLRTSVDFSEAFAQTLAAAGYELRVRRRLGELIQRVRAATR